MTDGERQRLVGRLAAKEREFDRLLEELRTLWYQRDSERNPPPLKVGDRLDVAADRAQVLIFEIEEMKEELRSDGARG